MNMSEVCNCSTCIIKSTPATTLNNHELEKLCCNSVGISFTKGEQIIKQGSLSTNIIYIREGLVKLYMQGPLKKDEIIKVAKAPEFIGLPSSFTDRVHPYSATALTKVDACFIDLNTFNEFIVSNGDFAQRLITCLSEDIINHFSRCANKTQKQLCGYLAEVLLFFSESIFDSYSFEIPLNRSELASFAGSTRESVTRILKDFVDDGIICMTNKKISIQNVELLRKISATG